MSKQQSGFSLIEAVVVLVFIGITAAVFTSLIFATESDTEKKIRLTREQIMLINNGIGAYIFDTGKPIPKNHKELQILVDEGYFQELPIVDPWGQKLIYNNPPLQSSNRPYDLFSLGPDKIESEDDIINWDLFGKRAERYQQAIN